MIYLTPYDIITKTAQAPSMFQPSPTLAQAESTLPSATVLSRSSRLVLLSLDGDNGIALSDFVISAAS